MKLVLAKGLTIDTESRQVQEDGLRFFISGESGSGKSTAAALITGQWILGGGQTVVLDLHSEYQVFRMLAPKDRVYAFGYGDRPLDIEFVDGYVQMLGNGKNSLLFDVSEWADTEPEMLDRFVFELMKKLYHFQRRRTDGKHVLVLVDEASHFAPSMRMKHAGEGAKVRQFVNMGTGGRKFGLHMETCTQRPALVDHSLISTSNVKVFMRTGESLDYRAITPYLPKGLDLKTLSHFDSGEAVVVSRWLPEPVRVRLYPPPVAPARGSLGFLVE